MDDLEQAAPCEYETLLGSRGTRLTLMTIMVLLSIDLSGVLKSRNMQKFMAKRDIHIAQDNLKIIKMPRTANKHLVWPKVQN